MLFFIKLREKSSKCNVLSERLRDFKIHLVFISEGVKTIRRADRVVAAANGLKKRATGLLGALKLIVGFTVSIKGNKKRICISQIQGNCYKIYSTEVCEVSYLLKV